MYNFSDTYDFSSDSSDHCGDYDIPEPLDQWAIEDFEQFAGLAREWRGYP